MYRKYRLFNIRYLYRGKKYRDVPVHQCIIAGLELREGRRRKKGGAERKRGGEGGGQEEEARRGSTPHL